MRYAFIKDRNCINIVVFDDVEKANSFKEVLVADKVIDDLILMPEDLQFGMGDIYDNGVWIKNIPIIDLGEEKETKIFESKNELEEYLQHNPLLFLDGKYYSVTKEKQSLLTSALSIYQLKVQAGVTPAILKWNAIGEECSEWEFEDLSTLALTIANYVAPLISKQQSLEMQIRNCTNIEELDNIIIDYEVV